MSRYSVAGVSINKGKVKVRFCSDLVLRVKNLQKQGDTDINLIELPTPMTKPEVCKFLLTRDEFKKYAEDIEQILGKKISKVNTEQPRVTLQPVEVDSEIESIRELAAA